MAQPSPQLYYEVLQKLLLDLFGHNWHLGYWLNADNPAEAAVRLNEIMLARLRIKEEMTVLDLGCGVGGPACFIAEKTHYQVIGLSNSPLGVAEAERYAKQRGVQDLVRFHLGEATRMPFGDNSFDAVWSCEAIHNIEDKEPLAREIARVLKPGGTVILGDLFWLWEPGQKGQDLERFRQFSFHLLTADRLIEIMQAHNIRIHESISIGHHIGPKSPAMCAEICREKAGRSAEKTLERMILERTIDATSLLAEGFALGKISWGIWAGRKKDESPQS